MSLQQSDNNNYSAKIESWIHGYSEESFLDEYQKYDKTYKTAMYSELISGATKNIISSTDINQFEKYLQLIICIHNFESKVNPTEFNENINKIIKNNNLIIIACKYNRLDIVTCIISENNQSYMACFRPGDKDSENHNAFYYAIRQENIGFSELLFDQWLKYANSEELIRALADAYEELRLKNFILSPYLTAFIGERLMNHQFYSDDSDKTIEITLQDIEERGKLLIESIQLFRAEYLNTDDFDDKLMLRVKFISTNINILKRQMKATYSKIFWEEMEFYLNIYFITKQSNNKPNEIFYKFLMKKSKLLDYLDIFAKLLENEMKNIHEQDIKKLSNYPNEKRIRIISKILKSNPQYQEMYEDFQRLKDAHCLDAIGQSLNISLSVDADSKYGQWALKRSLLTIGEMIKCNWESPNMTRSLSLLLLTSLPLRTRQIIVSLHNTSPIYAQVRKLDTELKNDYDEEDNIFKNIQTDLQVIRRITKNILHVTLVHYVTVILETIIATETIDDLKSYLKLIDINFTVMWFAYYEIENDQKLEQLVREFNDRLDKNRGVDVLIESLTRISQIAGADIKNRFQSSVEFLHLKGLCNAVCEDISNNFTIDRFQELKQHAEKSLINKLDNDIANEILTTVPKNLFDIFHDFGSYTQWRICQERIVLINQIHIQIGFGLLNYDWLENLRTQVWTKRYMSALNLEDKVNFVQEKKELSKQLSKEYTSKVNTLKNIFDNYEFNEFYNQMNNATLFTVLDMLTLEIMSIMDSSSILVDNYLNFDLSAPILVGKMLYHQIVNSAPLITTYFTLPLVLYLNTKKLTSKSDESIKKIGKVIQTDLKTLKSKYAQNLSSVINQNEMFQAIEQGDLKKLDETISKGADIRGSDYRGWTVLHYAAKEGNCDIFKYLFNQKINSEAKNNNEELPMHIAVKYGQADIVKFLIQEKANLNVVNIKRATPLCLAVRFGQKDIVEMLLSHQRNYIFDLLLQLAVLNDRIDILKMLLENCEADIDSFVSKEKETLLHLSAKIGSEKITEYLISLKSNVNSLSITKTTPLHKAASNGHLNTIKILISNKADINARSIGGSNALHNAVLGNHEQTVEYLLNNNADVNHSYVYGLEECTALHRAAEKGFLNIVKLLVKHKANIKAESNEEQTALHLAAVSNHFEVVKFLIENKAPVKLQDSYGNTAVHYAATAGNIQMMGFLLRNGGQIDKKNHDDQSPLYMAVYTGKLEMVKFLIDRGANYSASKDNQGLNALHVSAQKNRLEIVKFFIGKNVNIDEKSTEGSTALTIAAYSGCEKIVEALVDAGASLSPKNGSGYTSLHLAILRSNFRVIDYLLSKKVDITIPDSKGRLAIHLAAELNQIQVVSHLLKINKDLVNAQDNLLRTPLFFACLWNHAEMVKLLIKNGARITYEYMHCMDSAVFGGSKEVVEVLLNNKIKVDDFLSHGIPILHRAVQNEYYDIVKFLISKKADVNAYSTAKETALMIAIDNDFTDIALLLLKNGANVDMVNNNNESAIEIAIIGNRYKTFKALVTKFKIGDKDEKYKSKLIHLSAIWDSPKIVSLLIDMGLNANSLDENGRTPLHLAAKWSREKAVRVLLQKGSCYDAKDSCDKTPIYYAKFPSVIFLLETTAKLFDLVRQNNYNECLECLKQNPVVDALDICKLAPLHYACWHGFSKIVELLLEFGAQCKILSKFGTPLHFAVRFNHYDIVKILLIHGAVYNQKNPLGQLIENLTDNPEIVDLLKLIKKTFYAIKKCDTSIVDELKEIKEYDLLKCILNACNESNQTINSVAKKSNFPETELAEIYGHENYLFTKIQTSGIL